MEQDNQHVAIICPSTTYHGKMRQPDLTALTVPFRASISLQLTLVFPMTCYLAVLWPEL